MLHDHGRGPYYYYLGFLKKGLSLTQNIDAMFFAANAPLRHEFDYLYAWTFDNPHNHLAVIEALGRRRAGEPDDDHLWTHLLKTPRRNTWCGLAFELVCLEHLPQIKQALGISGVVTQAHSWRCAADPDAGINGSQVDLLIARQDRVINICEMKYSGSDFTVTKAFDKKLREKVADFARVTHTRDAIHLTLVTTYGLEKNTYFGAFQSVVTTSDLFGRVRNVYKIWLFVSTCG